MGKVAEAFAVDAAGNPVTLQEHQVQAAQDVGYKPVSGQYATDLQGAKENKEYVDENWGTAGKAAMGLGSGLTLGLGPAALAGLGIVDPGHLEAAQETGAYTAGDIAGMIAPAILSGGEAVAARGAAGASRSLIGRALALSPAGLMNGTGGAAERLIGRFLPEAGLLGKLGAPTLKMAARGASEGAIVNLSHTVADNIIQNKPLAAQALLASGVDGALFGGLTGGILGGVSAVAGAGVDVLGGRVASGLAGGTAETSAAKALKRLGATEGTLTKLGSEGNLVTPLKGYYKVLQDGGESLASETGTISKTAKAMEAKYAAVADDAVAQLQRESPSVLDNRLAQMSERIKTDLVGAYQGTMEQGAVSKIYAELKKDLSGMKTWEHWTSTREQLADRMQAAGGIQKDVYKTALSAFDGELTAAMQKANPELATTYQAAATGQRNARDLVEMINHKSAVETSAGNPLHFNGADAATMGYSVLSGGNPMIGAGLIAGKKIVAHVQQKLQPAIAEAAYRSAIGANAAHATVSVGNRISDGLKSFMTGTRQTAIGKHSPGSKLSYTMANYQKSMDLADELTSAAHGAKVRELTNALSLAGHDELSKEMAGTYDRAVAYINQNKPKGGSKEHAMGNLGKTAKAVGLTTQGMKFMRQLHSMVNPMGAVIDGLQKGDVSRDAVAAMKYVYPDIHQDIVMRASQEIVSMKEEGKYLPADKVAMLGLVLDAPVDSKLTKEYIGEVQKGLAANKAPAPEQSSPAPITDTSSYKTPLQATV